MKNAVATVDAAGGQKSIASKVVSNKGDCILAVKGIQELLHQVIQEHSMEQMEKDFATTVVETYQKEVKGHGRVDDVTHNQMPVPDVLAMKEKWKGFTIIGVDVCISEQNGDCTSDVESYVSSLPLIANRFWAIYTRSLSDRINTVLVPRRTLQEDGCGVRNRKSVNNLDWLKQFALSLLNKQKDKHSVAARRRIIGWNLRYLPQVLGIHTV